MDEEVVAHGEQHVHVRLERQPPEKLGESGLDFGPVQCEQLLELIHDQQRLFVAFPPPGDQPHRNVGMLEPQQLAYRLGVTGDLSRQLLGQGNHRRAARGADDAAPPFRQGRDQPGPEERAFAGAGGPDDRLQMRPAQLAPHLLDLHLAAEEILGVLLRERRQARIRATIIHALHAQDDLLQRPRQRLRRRIAPPRIPGHGPQQHWAPGAGRQSRRFLAHAGPESLAGGLRARSPHADHLGQHHPRREEVGPGVQTPSLELLGRHVGARSRDRVVPLVRDRRREPEIHQDDAPCARDHDVPGLDVPMYQSGLVDGLQTHQELGGDLHRFPEIERSPLAQNDGQRRAIHCFMSNYSR